MKRFLIKHIGNMGDFVFFIPPVLETLKKKYPNCHITLITAWGWKDKNTGWGKRNQGGYCINLAMTNPHIDQLVHWHDTTISLEGELCVEEGIHFPTWNAAYFERQKKSGEYDGVYELDFGIKPHDNPLKCMYKAINLPEETLTHYRLYFTQHDRSIAQAVMADVPRPRIVLLEAMAGDTTREWNKDAVSELDRAITRHYGVAPVWFGGRHIPDYHGQPLTLRENIATLELCDVAIGPLSGPLHFAAGVGIPTLTLYCDHEYWRAAPAYFLNDYVSAASKKHRTLWGPSPTHLRQLKSHNIPPELTSTEMMQQNWQSWLQPGRQATKSCLGVITIDEIMTVLSDIVLDGVDHGEAM